jgi:hypothetical protein
LVPTEDATLSLWRAALADIAKSIETPFVVASWRGGALIDDDIGSALGWWRMTPLAGASIVKTMLRTRIAGEKEAGRSITAEQLRAQLSDGPLELAGNRLSHAMVAELDRALPSTVVPLRTVAPGAAEGQVKGSALWLRAEPGEDSAMAEAMAADIAAWATTCAAG